MKKILSMILAFVMVFSIATMGVSAASGNLNDTVGSITINGIVTESGTHYELYKLLDLETYNTDGKGAYSYKVNATWQNFFTNYATAPSKDGLDYVEIDAKGYVTWKKDVSESLAAEFAKLALDYAKTNGISPVKTTKISDSHPASDMEISGTKGVFSNLSIGYYLVDSTVGALCGLTTTNPDASINAKNKVPTIDKQVKEDSTGQWGSKNTADIGQIVEYRVTINVHAGAENFVLHENLPDGVTFKIDNQTTPMRGITKIEHVDSSSNNLHEEVSSAYYTVRTKPGIEGDTGIAVSDATCDFEIVFNQEFCNHIDTNDKIVIYYNAMLNKDAVIAGNGNTNRAWLTYGDNHNTSEDSATTYTYKFDLVKTDSQNTLIEGAEFEIYDSPTNGNLVKVVQLFENDGTTPKKINEVQVYRRARADEANQTIKVTDGMVSILGFDNGTYYLKETKVPSGYNRLDEFTEFTISDGNLEATFNGNIYSTGSGVHVVNKSGNMLPETGGFGTTMFITFGTIAVLGAGVLLVTKKRMSMIDE